MLHLVMRIMHKVRSCSFNCMHFTSSSYFNFLPTSIASPKTKGAAGGTDQGGQKTATARVAKSKSSAENTVASAGGADAAAASDNPQEVATATNETETFSASQEGTTLAIRNTSVSAGVTGSATSDALSSLPASVIATSANSNPASAKNLITAENAKTLTSGKASNSSFLKSENVRWK